METKIIEDIIQGLMNSLINGDQNQSDSYVLLNIFSKKTFDSNEKLKKFLDTI